MSYRPASGYETVVAQNLARRGPLRFEEGVATDTDIPNDFGQGAYGDHGWRRSGPSVHRRSRDQKRRCVSVPMSVRPPGSRPRRCSPTSSSALPSVRDRVVRTRGWV